MIETDRTVRIARPPADVFPWLVEPDRLPRWMDGLRSARRLDEGPLAAGARMRQEFAGEGAPLVVEIECVEVAPPRVFAFRGDCELFSVEGRFELADAGGSTDLRYRERLQPEGWKMKLLGALLRSTVEQRHARAFETLQRVAEA